jgi:multidrug efflux pump subunit AcrB
VVNDSLLLVSRYNELKHQLSVTEAILQTCTDRLRAIFLTSITTFAGLLPILSEDSMQAEFLKPAAASMAYGILFATVITLILIPVLLKVVDDVVNFYSQNRVQIKSVGIE